MATGRHIETRIASVDADLRPRQSRFSFTATDTDPEVIQITGADGMNVVSLGVLRRAANTPHVTVELFGCFNEVANLSAALASYEQFPAAIMTINTASPPAAASNVLQPEGDDRAIIISAENFIFPVIYIRVTFAAVQAGADADVIVSMRSDN